jgi:hypothetical protein
MTDPFTLSEDRLAIQDMARRFIVSAITSRSAGACMCG